MGRPINKRLIGDPAGPGLQVTATVNVDPADVTPTGPEAGIILSQRSNSSYRVEGGTSGIIAECQLVDSATPALGEMSITILPDGASPGSEEYVSNLNNRTARTFSGNVYAWPENPDILGRTVGAIQNQE